MTGLVPLLITPPVIPQVPTTTPGVPSMWADIGSNPVNLILTAAAVLAAMVFLAGAVRAIFRWLRRVTHFLDDWQGQDERPGFPARPGVMARLQEVEDRTRQLKPNGGSHLADKIAAIESRVAGISDHLRDRDAQLDALEALRTEKSDAHKSLELRLAALELAIRVDAAPEPDSPRSARRRRIIGEPQGS